MSGSIAEELYKGAGQLILDASKIWMSMRDAASFGDEQKSR